MREKEKSSRFGCIHAKARLKRSVHYSTALQDRNALLCHSCEFRLTIVKKLENKL